MDLPDDMVKMVVLLVRKDGWTHDEFTDYFHGTHAAIAEDLPGLQRYVTSIPTDPEKSAYDAMAELYFEDMAALAGAFDSEVGEETLADAEEFSDTDEMVTMYVEETVQVGEEE